ncbi:MAG: cell envelope integrity protein CreD [Thermodesulfobacteriota bacterium]
MTTQDAISKTGDFIRNSASVKIISIGILVLVLLIPTSMISSLMRERESRRDSVVAEITQKWGSAQTITGPFLTVPYKSFYKDDDDKVRQVINYFHILPDKLRITGRLDPQVRYRSLYEAVVYEGRIDLSGAFTVPELSQLNIELDNILWQKAVFAIGLTDMRGIKENINVIFADENYAVSPGLKTSDIARAGVSAPVPLSQGDRAKEFSFSLNLNGSEQIRFTPLGEETVVSLKSSWASPSFNGAFLPSQRQISEDGFVANWRVLHLNRNYPQFWQGSRYKVDDSRFGLKLLITADVYQKSIRIAKYALMFVVFTFSAFFFSEIISKNKVHPIQYLLIGLAVILFYVLLLSISEHLSFDSAYLLASFAVTVLITAYSRGMGQNKQFTAILFSLLVSLYLYLYIVLQLEDYALLMGSVGLLAVLGTVMFITRKVNWYALEGGE